MRESHLYGRLMKVAIFYILLFKKSLGMDIHKAKRRCIFLRHIATNGSCIMLQVDSNKHIFLYCESALKVYLPGWLCINKISLLQKLCIHTNFHLLSTLCANNLVGEIWHLVSITGNGCITTVSHSHTRMHNKLMIHVLLLPGNGLWGLHLPG